MVTTVDKEHVARMWREYKRDTTDIKARNWLVERYVPIVKYNARRVRDRLPENVDLDDLVSAGIFGLMDAIAVFDLSRGVKFETYCVMRIRGAMLDELREMDWVPRLVRLKANKLNAAIKSLGTRLGRHPTEIELAEQMEITVPELEKMIVDANAVKTTSISGKQYETDSYKDVRLVDSLIDQKGESPTRSTKQNDIMRLVTRGLSQDERLIVLLYYYEGVTMKEIGRNLEISESRVSQMHSAIVRRWKQRLAGCQSELRVA